MSENRRFLVTADGQPFFWLADTAWWIRQLPPPLVQHYLSTRAQQDFNVIQVHGGLAVTNHAGASPFLSNTPESPNEPFWRELDRVVAAARAHRLYVALVPMWGDEYGRAFGTNAGRAFAFGQWVGRRCASESHVVWMVSGEYDAINGFKLPINAAQKNLLMAVAHGRGTVLTFAGSPDFATASEHHTIEARRLIRNAVRFVNPMPRVEITAPAHVETVVTDDAASRTLRIHLLGYNSPPQTTPAKERPYAFRVLRLARQVACLGRVGHQRDAPPGGQGASSPGDQRNTGTTGPPRSMAAWKAGLSANRKSSLNEQLEGAFMEFVPSQSEGI